MNRRGLKTSDGRVIIPNLRVRVLSEGLESSVGEPAFDRGGFVRIRLTRWRHMLVRHDDLGVCL
jgi:hypothetical protein